MWLIEINHCTALLKNHLYSFFINQTWTWKSCRVADVIAGSVRVKPDPWQDRHATDHARNTRFTRRLHHQFHLFLSCVCSVRIHCRNNCPIIPPEAQIMNETLVKDVDSRLFLRLNEGNIHGLHHILETVSSLFPVNYCLKYCSLEIIWVEKLNTSSDQHEH